MVKRKKTNRIRSVGFALTEEEYHTVQKHWKETTIIKLSEYLRRVLFGKPVTVYTRSQSLDELVAELILLRRELHTIRSNFDQMLQHLRSLENLPQIQYWVGHFERDKAQLASNVAEIQIKINSISEQWLQ